MKKPPCYTKKSRYWPVAGGEETKQTNEIGMFIPLLDGLDIQGKDITADALLMQRKLATYLVQRQAHYHFTVKAIRPHSNGHRATVPAAPGSGFRRCLATRPRPN